MTERTEGVQRDEEQRPLSKLKQTVTTWDTDGQSDPDDNDTAGQAEDEARPGTAEPR